MENVLKKKRKFPEVFPEVGHSGIIKKHFSDAKVQRVKLYKKSKKLEIQIVSCNLIPAQVLDSAGEMLEGALGLENVCIKVLFDVDITANEIFIEYWESVLYIVRKNIALSRGLLTGCTCSMEGKKLYVYLKTRGGEILKNNKCDALIEKILKESFGLSIRVEFVDYAISEERINRYIEHKENEETKIVTDIVMNNLESQALVSESTGTYTPDGRGRGSQIILGKDFDDMITSMQDVTQDSGRIAICGEIINTQTRILRSGKILCIFDVTDYTSSITVKIFLNKNKQGPALERLKEKTWVKIKGEAQYDRFSKEPVVIAKDVIQVHKNAKEDNYNKKRVELHLHTQMSALDAITPVKEMVKRAAQWGHKAIAVTDHGVVQAYPEAFEAGKRNNIKIIYGVEAYLLDDAAPIVYGADERSFDDDFVVFDIETTGLNSSKDRITEIGAVKLRNGEVIDRYSSLVNPQIPIPGFITKLTGITDAMVKEAPTIETVLPEFLKFSKGCALVAHNASFDIGFIRHYLHRIGVELNNPIIDTLELSRQMFPELRRHKLNIVAKHLGIELKNHHRAVDDATACAGILKKCIKVFKEKGITTIDSIDGNINDSDKNFKSYSSYHAIILVKNHIGLKNLYKIISKSHLKYFYKRPRVPKKLLMKYKEGLILGSACEAGELYRAIINNKSDEEIARIAKFYDYLEIQPLGNNEFLMNNGTVDGWEQLRDINREIVALGDKYNKPVVATCDVHFMDPEDEVFRRILMAGQGFSDADNQAPLYFRTTEEMLDEFLYLGEDKCHEVVITNTNLIADMCEDIVPIPDGTFPPKIEGAENEIRLLSEKMARELYGEKLPQIVQKRMEKELDSIIKNGFSVMYIIAQKLVSKSLEDGYLVGSRGSVGSSFVAYLTGITEVNSLPPHYVCDSCQYCEFVQDRRYGCGFDLPAKGCPVCGKELKRDGYDIPFETFLGFDGDKEPDIDLNFSGDYQPIAHRYTEELFGEGNVYRAGTIATIADKTAYGFVKNYLDDREMIKTNAEIGRLIKGCTGIKRTTGQHPGGVMIVPQDKEIYEFCPIQRPADDIKSNVITTHFDYHSISGRLLKLDILGHDDPTVIKMLEDLTGIDARDIPIGEKVTMGIFSSTEPLGIEPEDINSEVGTLAIPEFGTKFVRQMLVDTRPTTFAELIRISGLSHGTDVWLNNAQELIRDGIATLLEVICTRDDIMLYLMHRGIPNKIAFKIMEDVRKGKGLKEEYEKAMRDSNIPNWYTESCKKIKYMFPKAHAAAYVMMAFRIAWFKVYYPEAFYATYFTVRADEFDAGIMCNGQHKVKNSIREIEQKGNDITQKEKNVLTILEVTNEMYARGINFLPMDIYKSDPIKFQVTPDGILPPLNALQGLGKTAAQRIFEARNNGEFLSVEDVRDRAKVSKTVIEILRQSGCFSGMSESNQISLFG